MTAKVTQKSIIREMDADELLARYSEIANRNGVITAAELDEAREISRNYKHLTGAALYAPKKEVANG